MNMKVLKSIGAVFAGLVANVILALGTDYPLEKFGLMKLPFSENSTWFVLGVTFYRLVYSVLGCYITAILAPDKPFRHAMILGLIGVILSTLGLVAMWDQEPKWYPISLIVLALPCAWIGGKLKTK
jgi:hypothetical protein